MGIDPKTTFLVLNAFNLTHSVIDLDVMDYRRLKITSLLILLAVAGCSTSSNQNKEIDRMLDREVGDISDSLAAQIMAEPVSYKSKSRARIEGEIQRKVRWWIRYYTVNDRERFQRNLTRGEKYRPLVQQILNEHRLPPELFYLAMIESGFVEHATSHASAVGIWQFMRPTALNYGLGVSGSLDERRHPIQATHAAARYLTDLHRKFNSWYLAIAAYNCGQGRVDKAIKRGRSTDFWRLADGGFLPKETMDYIPKFLAAASIGDHLQQFGFNELKPMPLAQQWPEVTQVQVRKAVKLSAIAKRAHLTETELLRLNPSLRHTLSTRGKSSKNVRVWVPRNAANRFAEKNSSKFSS